MSFAAIGELLKNRVGKGHFNEKVVAALVCEEFDKIIFGIWGEKIKESAKALYLKNNILTVACLSPVVAQEIRIKEYEILEELNKKFAPEDRIVEKLRILI
ncbi:DUF721 domain-containing protein [Candidatus Kuenenbacteria bacterium]|nr:DUF721 domain-containing protein [Candidatus Kuenenbacteria bacterium]